MAPKLHFISGLPRSGSTLLSAILRQNPRFHAAMSSPVGSIFNSSLSAMGAGNEFALFLDETQKRDILMGIFDGYYRKVPPESVVFDTNRMWTSRLPALLKLFPQSKVICCVRNPAWVLDSVETLLRRNALDVSRIFQNEGERATVFSRAEALMGRNRMIGFALAALKEAYYSHEAGAMLLVDYNLLAARPEDTLRLVYQFLDEPWFDHDFNDVSYEAETFDTHLLAKGLHTVRGKVELRERRTLLPPELFRQFSDLTFWINNRQTLAHHIVPRSMAEAGEGPGR
jgi:sulfotransferase